MPKNAYLYLYSKICECIEFRDCVVQNGSDAQQKESTNERNFSNRIHSINALQMHRRKSLNRWNKQINLDFAIYLCVNYLVLSHWVDPFAEFIPFSLVSSFFFACGGVWTSASALHSTNDDLFCVYIGRSVACMWVDACVPLAVYFVVAAAAAAVATSTASFTLRVCVFVCVNAYTRKWFVWHAWTRHLYSMSMCECAKFAQTKFTVDASSTSFTAFECVHVCVRLYCAWLSLDGTASDSECAKQQNCFRYFWNTQ